MVFHWSLSDTKTPQVSRTLQGILTVLNNVVVFMFSTHPSTPHSSSPFNNPLVTLPNAPITIGIIVTFLFHRSFQFPSKVEVLILHFTFFQFYSVVSRYSKVHSFACSFFYADYYKVWCSGRDYLMMHVHRGQYRNTLAQTFLQNIHFLQR